MHFVQISHSNSNEVTIIIYTIKKHLSAMIMLQKNADEIVDVVFIASSFSSLSVNILHISYMSYGIFAMRFRVKVIQVSYLHF